MEDFSQSKIKITFSSESFEIPVPNTYQELFTIFINKFKIEENSQKFLNITYHDEDDEIYISSEEDYQLFISQLRENNINNNLKGALMRDSREIKDLRKLNDLKDLKEPNKNSFNEKFNNMQKALLGEGNEDYKNEDNLSNKFSFESLIDSKISFQEIIDRKEKEKEKNFDEKEKEYKTQLELKEKENKMNCDKFNLEIEKLKEEKQKLEQKLNEYDIKSKEQDMDIKNYKNQVELKEKEYKSIIDNFNMKIKVLTEEKLEKDKIIDNYNKESKEKEEKYRNISELNNKNIIEIEKYNYEIKALKEANQNLESKLDIYKKNALEQETKEKEYNSKIESYISQIKILKEQKLKDAENNFQKDQFKSQIKILKEEKNKLKQDMIENEKKIKEYKGDKNDDEYQQMLKEKDKLFELKGIQDKKIENFLKDSIQIIKINEKDNIKGKDKKSKDDEKFGNDRNIEDENKNLKEKLNEYIKNNKFESSKIFEIKEEQQNSNLLIKEHEKKNQNNNFNFSLMNIESSNNQLIESTLAHQSEEYKNTLNEIKNKYKNDLNKKCKEIIKNKDDIYSNIYNEINKQSQIIINKYLKKLEEFENKRRNELIDMIFNKNNPPLSEIIHEGVKCERCSVIPIIGDRYQCSKCPKYNLCEKCEEENSIDKAHNHYFIRIRSPKNRKVEKKKSNDKKDKNMDDDKFIDDDDDIKNGKINRTVDNNNKIKINNITCEFKHECERPKNESIFSKLVNNIDNNNNNNLEEKFSVSFENLKETYFINIGVKSYDIIFNIKNNCNLQYPNGVVLVLNEKDSLFYPNQKRIKINPLRPNESQEIKLSFSKLKSFSPGTYSTFLNFLINEEIFDFIEIKFNLKEKKK